MYKISKLHHTRDFTTCNGITPYSFCNRTRLVLPSNRTIQTLLGTRTCPKDLLETCIRNRNGFSNVINKVSGYKSIFNFLNISLHFLQLIFMSTNINVIPFIHIMFQSHRVEGPSSHIFDEGLISQHDKVDAK